MPRKEKSQTAIQAKGKNNVEKILRDEELDNDDVDSEDVEQIVKNVSKSMAKTGKDTGKSAVKTTAKQTTVKQSTKTVIKKMQDESEESIKQTKGKNSQTKSVSNANEKDSSDISDIADNESISDAFNYDAKKSQNNGDEDYDDMDEDAKREYIQTVVLDRVIKYVKLDDVIKEKQAEHKKEMKAIKDSKEQLENFLIGYLDKVDEEYVQLGNKATLIKTEVKTKAAPKMEDISVCLVEGFRKHEIYEDDSEIKRVVKDFIESIDAKREVKTRKYLKRTQGDPGEIVQRNKKGTNKGEEKEDVDAENVDANKIVADTGDNMTEDMEIPKGKAKPKKQYVQKKSR